MRKSLILSSLCFTLVACGEKVSLDTVETQRAIASENALFNAQKWRANGLYPDYSIVSRGDSTQSRECPQGDGWATIDLISPGKDNVVGLKCSTYSANIGCMSSTEFKSKVYATQEGRCNTELEGSIKKIAQ